MSLRTPTSSNYGSKPSSPSSASKDDGGGSGSSTEFRYEELHDGLTCPTCQGTGRIPRGQEDSLVALIPYSDKRLRPRRTVLYVCIAVIVSLLAAGLLIFFLFPREVTLKADKVETLAVTLNRTNLYLQLCVQNTFNISNKNFVSAELDTVTVEAVYRHKIQGSSETDINTSVHLRESAQITTVSNITFSGPDAVLVTWICDPDETSISHNLLIKFQVTLQTTFLSHTEESTLTEDFFVPCVLSKDKYRR